VRGDQLARQWRLIQRLAHSRAGVALDDLAHDLECVRRTVYRDLDALMFAGFPVTSERRDGRVFYRFLDGFRLGDVPFTSDEILALAFGEDLLRCLEGTVFHESIGSAIRKIRAGLGPELVDYLARLGESFRVLPGPHKSYARYRDVIRTLSDAVVGRRRLRMRYRTARSGRVSTRELDPYRVFYRAGGLYVVGHDHRSGELRTFAVDRIGGLERTDSRFQVPASFDFDRMMASSFGVVAEAPTRVRIRFAPEWASWIEERTWHPTQKLHRGPAGLELTLEVGGTEELRSWILSFGPGALVLEPAGLRDEVQAALAAALARYAGEPAPPPATRPGGTTARRARRARR
jgi:predicted DNA-binding transcriptional regulator YafY